MLRVVVSALILCLWLPASAVTDAAPRRSISKAQKPSKVPTSRQRLPASELGNGI